MDLMLCSGRAYGDLVLARLFSPFCMPFVLRKWDDRVIPETEIRTFVNHGKITAATQYYTLLYSQFLHENKELIFKRLNSFFTNTLAPIIPVKKYALDVSCIPEKILCATSNDAECFIVIEVLQIVPCS